ncbi:fibronectin type III domain-containing protein [Barnesiella intestinihominis]|jgi:predicted phosphodiesterase|uniref:fibronectin type III domain-containing protein n=1 Tax=Barnesiella intestinihominis TaxID=487174 RepID=UPI00189A8DDF|nr:carbohydrate binding domain-containing protein [Barnesiella intestinihominis]MDB0664507.1 DUF4957 domain-containing protein [Barnesiella intestinihominis]MDB0668581.1 DUF4957 domain-containing protein [Barnesiella intestinihominis]
MKKFLLLSLFLSALYVRAAVVPVSGTETIADAVSSAVAGDIIELSEAVTYVGNVTIDKSLTLRAAEGLESAPIIQGKLSIKDGATIRGIVFDGASEVADAIRIDDTVTGAPVVISGCTVRNYTNRFVYVSLSGKIESLTIDDCIFIGADNSTTNKAIYASSAHTQVETLSVTNSTFLNFNTGSNYFFRINCGEELVLMPVVLIDHCTFYNCYDRRGVYLYNAGRSTIKNCISAFSERRDDTKSFTAYGDESIVKNVISYNVDLYGSAPKENIISKNPLFVDAENGNFQLYKDSPAVGAGDDGSDLGDPRWGVSTENAPVGELPYECFKKPYSMSPTTHSVRILWQTLDSNPSGTVYYGKTPDLGQKLTAETGWNVDGEGFVHVIELTGLEPFTEYYYQVGDESRRYETICTAKTAPEKGTDFRLVAFSDVHDNDEKIWQNSAPIMLGVDPDMWITIGDLVNKGDMRTWNSAFFIPGESMLTAKTLTSVIGNHETMDKSDENGPTTYYDYFSVPSHGYIDTDERIDPRGESYFAMDYGDVKIIGCNWNEGKDDPSFATGSKQLTWLDEQLTNADSKWIFIFAHVNVYSTSYHGQWSASQKEYIAPLLEKHALAGKHILVFGGDEHNFEHLYKAGVHYLRPGAMNGSNRDQYNMVDKPYSLMFNKIAGFSTIDVSENGEKVKLIARDRDGNEFYSYEFTRSGGLKPSLYITEPNGNNGPVTDSFKIKWSCFDPQGTAKINLYYSLDSINGTSIVTGLSSDVQAIDSYDWNVRNLQPKGDYWIYGTIDDGVNTPVRAYAKGKVSVVWDTTPPPAPSEFTGNFVDGRITLSWKNPVYEIPVNITVDDFENGITSVEGVGDSGGRGSLEEVDGYEGKALQMTYDIDKAWGEYAAVLAFEKARDFSDSPYLEFWYKGDGSSRTLRLIVKEDNDLDGNADDWWYNETLPLNSTEWKKAKIDIRTFQAFDWHPNTSKKCDALRVISLDFVVPSSAPCSGGVLALDDIAMTGLINPAPDFEATTIVRRNDRFAADETDGEIVYDGEGECYTDSELEKATYYYAAFSRDDLKNYSAFTEAATWKYTVTTGVDGNKRVDFTVAPNPVREYVTVIFPGDSVSELSVINSQGEIVMREKLKESVTSLPVEGLSPGIYLVSVKSSGQIYNRKIVVE